MQRFPLHPRPAPQAGNVLRQVPPRVPLATQMGGSTDEHAKPVAHADVARVRSHVAPAATIGVSVTVSTYAPRDSLVVKS